MHAKFMVCPILRPWFPTHQIHILHSRADGRREVQAVPLPFQGLHSLFYLYFTEKPWSRGHTVWPHSKGQQETRQQYDLSRTRLSRYYWSRTRFSQYDWSRNRTQLRMRRGMWVLGSCPASFQKEFLTSGEYVTGTKEQEV